MHFIFYLILLVSAADYGNFGTYPKVPKTASINGFADPIYDLLPDCAKECVKFSTSNTPCPYWDTGCFCVMPQWAGLVGQCVAQKCKGEDVASARFLATSLCSVVGANTWMMPASISSMLSTAAGDAKLLQLKGKLLNHGLLLQEVLLGALFPKLVVQVKPAVRIGSINNYRLVIYRLIIHRLLLFFFLISFIFC